MQELWSSASYEPHLLSLPFAFAPAAVLVVIVYGIVMRGEPRLRAWMLVHFAAILPYTLTMALSPSIKSAAAAREAFAIAAACIPLAAAAGAGFQLHLLGKRGPWRAVVWAGVGVSVAWVVIGATTDLVVNGATQHAPGFWYATVGPAAWIAVVSTFALSVPGFVVMTRAALRDKPSDERRQLRLILFASYTTYFGLTDIMLAFGVPWFPLGWLTAGIGSVLVTRALVVEDLLRVRAIDTTAPRLVLHYLVALLFTWVVLGLLGHAYWPMTVVTLAMCFVGVRVSIATIGLVNRGGRGGEGPLERLLDQLVIRARSMTEAPEVAKLAIDIIELALGVRVDVLIAQAEDYGWTTAAGARIPDEDAPDPLLGNWLAEQRGARYADHKEVPDDLRDLLRTLLDRTKSRTVVPVTSNDELLALVLVPQPRPVRGRSLAFLEQAADRLGEALVHARMAQRAARRAELAREVELAAAVQTQLLPATGRHVLGDVTIVGSWMPATRCAGDFWGVYPLGERRVLVAIGDVTGHGVASATVTAAAAAACDVAVRRHGKNLELAQLIAALDAAVRRVGGGQLAMTCFAAIVDPDLREIRFVSCGHTSPYLCRAGEQAVELHALVGRGNPLGSGPAPAPKVQQKSLRAGDLVVWYTDGVIEAQDPAGEPYGDRRLQRMLRRLDLTHLTPPAVHDVIHAAIAAHRAGRPRADDETLVVGQWQPPMAASTEPARSV